MRIKELRGRQTRWEVLLSRCNFRIEYRPGKEEGKPDALTTRAGDLPTEREKGVTRNFRALLPRECWNIPEVEEIKIEERSYLNSKTRMKGRYNKHTIETTRSKPSRISWKKVSKKWKK